MKVDTSGFFRPADMSTTRELEDAGYDAVWAAEAAHDAFVSLAVAATQTSRIKLGTGIAIAFARTPMTIAVAANDLQLVSQGRFLLGLGSQIKPHITKRYSMPWSAPAARMREFVLATHAIWDSWAGDGSLRFVGDYYTHSLMTPMFNPGPNPYGRPPVYLAGVGPQMTQAAGEVADGFICHPFMTSKYIAEVTLPALAAGRAKDERGLGPIDVAGMPFVIVARNDEELRIATQATKKQMAFYGSTPAYAPVLELHGHGEVHDQLNAMSKRGEWDAMADVIPDDFLEELCIIGEPHEIAKKMHQRYAGLLDRLSFNSMYKADPSIWPPIVRELQGL